MNITNSFIKKVPLNRICYSNSKRFFYSNTTTSLLFNNDYNSYNNTNKNLTKNFINNNYKNGNCNSANNNNNNNNINNMQIRSFMNQSKKQVFNDKKKKYKIYQQNEPALKKEKVAIYLLKDH
eukprot:Pgem_evm1s17319